MTDPRLRPRPAITTAVLAVLGVTVAAVVAEALLQSVAASSGRGLLEHVLLEFVFVAFVVNGIVVVWHRPGNPIGWVLLSVGAAAVWFTPPLTWGEHLLATGRPLDAVGRFGLWANGWWFWAMLGLVMFHLPVLFPDGRLPSPRWRPVMWVVSSAVVALVVMGMTAPQLTGQDVAASVDNPIGIAWMPPVEGSALGDGLFAVQLFGLLAGIVSLTVRFRRSDGAERQQVKWFLAAVSLLVLLPLWEVVASALDVPGSLRVLAFPLVIASLPTAITVAVLRHRLWDIDRVVSRTLAYGLLAVLLVAFYAGGVLGLGAVARTVTGESGDVVVAMSTLAVAALFQPLRRRVQRAVDRRFDRARYDASRVVDAFGRDLRDELGLDAVCAQLRAVAGATFHPEVVGLVLVGFDDRGVRE